MSNKADILVKNLKSLRNERGWSQEKVGQMVHKSRQAINGYENGVEPPLSTVIALADVFGVSVDYLLGRSDFRSVDNEYISRETGLSDDSIQQLKAWKAWGGSLNDFLNILLSYDLECQRKGKEHSHAASAVMHLGHIIRSNPQRETSLNDHVVELIHQLKVIQEDINPEWNHFSVYPDILGMLTPPPSDPAKLRQEQHECQDRRKLLSRFNSDQDPVPEEDLCQLAEAVLRADETAGE